MSVYRFIISGVFLLVVYTHAHADAISERVIRHMVKDATVKMHLIENTSKQGLSYFLTGTITPHTQHLIKQTLSTYGGRAYWMLTPSITVQMGDKYQYLNLSDVHLVGGRYAWQSAPEKLDEDSRAVLLQIANWVQRTIQNKRADSADIFIIHAPNNQQGFDLITNYQPLYALSQTVGLNVAEIADPKPYNNMTIIMLYADEGDSKFKTTLRILNQFYGVGMVQKRPWTPLQHGAVIDLVAPSSAYPENYVKWTINILEKQGFTVRTKYLQQQKRAELYYSNTTKNRLSQFVHALNDTESDAVWVIRGGGGATNLLPYLLPLPPPTPAKPFIGFSDSTALHMFLNTQWNMPSIHGIVAQYNRQMTADTNRKVNNQANIEDMINILTAKTDQVQYTHLQPLNTSARTIKTLNTRIMGGNLTLVNALHGGRFFIQGAYQDTYTLLLEGVGNGLHQMERMLDALAYSSQLDNIDAFILGDFISYDSRMNTPSYRELLNTVVQRFADKTNIPVFRLNGVGHGTQNYPIPLNTKTTISVLETGDFSITIDIR